MIQEPAPAHVVETYAAIVDPGEYVPVGFTHVTVHPLGENVYVFDKPLATIPGKKLNASKAVRTLIPTTAVVLFNIQSSGTVLASMPVISIVNILQGRTGQKKVGKMLY